MESQWSSTYNMSKQRIVSPYAYYQRGCMEMQLAQDFAWDIGYVFAMFFSVLFIGPCLKTQQRLNTRSLHTKCNKHNSEKYIDQPLHFFSSYIYEFSVDSFGFGDFLSNRSPLGSCFSQLPSSNWNSKLPRARPPESPTTNAWRENNFAGLLKGLVPMVIISPVRIGLWDPFQMA